MKPTPSRSRMPDSGGSRMAAPARVVLAIGGGMLLAIAATVPAAGQTVATSAPANQSKDPYKSIYADYTPDFLTKPAARGGALGPRYWLRDEEQMRLSSEASFFTLNRLDQDSRANALVDAALAKEAQGQYREALKMYQLVITKYPNVLYRVCEYGVFVPISQYCQRRILGFPPSDLALYRTLYDARAKEAYEQARRQYSLIGLSEVVDTMLATSYGGRALLELGNAALDTGYYLAALEYFTTVRDFLPDPQLHTPELAMKIALCQRMLGEAKPQLDRPAPGKSELSADQLDRLRGFVTTASYARLPFHSQLTSPPNIAADDYTLLPPTTDPLGLQRPTWEHVLPGSRRDVVVYSQPVVSDNSVIYRHKNIVYCRSILNGELRWTNDLGGRAVWQNREERQYPAEDVLVQDGLVFTVISKAGPSLVALDEVTGQLKWAYGPMVAATEEEAKMRFEAAPAGGPRTIYATYVLDNIEGETHIDTAYGLIAFDSATGRVHWRTELCRLAPGKFTGGFAEERRNRIRSFTSPPLYHEGTVYCTTNAGAIAAVDSQSGRIKWLIRTPYHLRPESVHDATRQFGQLPFWSGLINTGGMHEPSFWLNQRPLLVGERLYVLPVDSPLMLCLDRRTGRIIWSLPKQPANFTYVLGPTREGHLVLATSGRQRMVSLIDPADGQTIWIAPDLIIPEDHPVVKYGNVHWGYTVCSITDSRNYSGLGFYLVARPFLSSDDRLITTYYSDYGHGAMGPTWCVSLAEVSLNDRKIIGQRRYYTTSAQTFAAACIENAKGIVKEMPGWLPPQDDNDRNLRRITQEIADDTVPVNQYGPFVPFSRVTFSRYGVPFELRFAPREISMVFDRKAVDSALARRTDPAADFARAELAVADSRFDEAATLLKKCLATISSEDLDFRAAINQQLYRVHQRLARSAIRTANRDEELANCLGMTRTASTLAEEIETLFALSEAYERKGDVVSPARCLRTVIETYGRHESPVSPLAAQETENVLSAATAALDRTGRYIGGNLYGSEFATALNLMKKGLPLYLSTVSPLPKTLTLRAGERAAAQLRRLQAVSPEFAKQFQDTANKELAGKPADEQLQRLWEFPGTDAAQKALDAQFAAAEKLNPVAGRLCMWQLADAARVCGLTVPDAFKGKVHAPPPAAEYLPVAIPQEARPHDFADEEGSARLVLERNDDLAGHPNLMFIGGRVRKRLDNKFTLTCIDLATGKLLWETVDIRLKGTGQEAGFYEAFVVGDRVVVHGLYDVLAYNVADGSELWHHRVPFDFEIKHAILSGDMLILSGKTETLCLYVPTDIPTGELAWQVGEMGDLYVDPYMRGDRLISVRKLPFSVTVRYRATGRLIGRLEVPDLSLHTTHPLLEDGPQALPAAHRENLLVLSDGWYYILIDTDKLAVAWKRLIDANDVTREPAMRFALSQDYLAVLKEDYDQKAIYMLSAKTGEILWQSDPKNSRGPAPMHSMYIQGDTIYGIVPHAGQGFYFSAYDAKTGKWRFKEEVKDYQGKPKVVMLPRLYGSQAVAQVEDRQEFEVKVFDAKSGKLQYTVKDKGVSPFGVHGRVSATVQAGRAVLLSKDKLQM